MRTLLHTFLELGDAVSRNLAFAHANDGKISYGEETVTETNLLEILRWHSDRGTQLTTISKGQEAKIGADWEWVVVGRKYSLFMRVQAKRTKKNDSLTIKHKVGKAPHVQEQIDILINNCPAASPGEITWKPVYCFYSKNSERKLWKSAGGKAPWRPYEYGCLIADATDIKKKTSIKTIQDVEDVSVPWHIFFAPIGFKTRYLFAEWAEGSDGTLGFLMSEGVMAASPDLTDDGKSPTNGFPTIEQLNGEMAIDKDMVGIRETDPEELERVRTRDRRDGVDAPRFLILDVKDEPSRRR